MERRRDERHSSNQIAYLTLLSEDQAATSDVRLPIRILNLSGQGLGFEADRMLPLGTAVRVDLEDSILLGEVCHCRQRDGVWECGLALDQALTCISDLARLMTKIMGEEYALPPLPRVTRQAVASATAPFKGVA